MSIKYGIKVPFDSTEVWVTEENGLLSPNTRIVKLFETREAAESAARIWKKYSVEEYFDHQSFDWENLAQKQTA